MKIIICLDNNNGMMFNNRRQSQDKLLRMDIKNMISNNKLYMNKYSYDLYKDIDSGNITVSETFLNKCNTDDYCLVENTSLSKFKKSINTLIIYRWNRTYPADIVFDIDINKNWQLISSKDFEGSSHEIISKETYKLKGEY